MDIVNDPRIVMTLDAGGTNFEFSAIQAGKEIVKPIRMPSFGDDLEKSLQSILKGFHQIRTRLKKPPVAISFAFPGPADYPKGIIGDLTNLPAYSGGVALGPMLEEEFDLPVFINNDGDLFAYGEAMAGLLPEINHTLREKNIPKQYSTLFGVTVGTGFGGGMVINNQLHTGDNSAASEVWITRNSVDSNLVAEEGVSIRAVQRTYNEEASGAGQDLSPKDIYEIAKGEKQGDQQAARYAFEKLGMILGETLANTITLLDGIMVIGGGLSGAAELFFPSMMKQLNGTISGVDGKHFSRLVSQVYNLEDLKSKMDFYRFQEKEITVPFSNEKISYTSEKRLAVGISRLGTGKATALGAYAFALNQL